MELSNAVLKNTVNVSMQNCRITKVHNSIIARMQCRGMVNFIRKIGRILGIMAKDGLIGKPSKGKKWNITEKGESELGD